MGESRSHRRDFPPDLELLTHLLAILWGREAVAPRGRLLTRAQTTANRRIARRRVRRYNDISYLSFRAAGPIWGVCKKSHHHHEKKEITWLTGLTSRKIRSMSPEKN
jgi:hypothetical protein